MKNITLFYYVTLFLLHCFSGIAQTASGNCTGITVSNIPSYPVVYFANVNFSNCLDGGGYYEGCDEGGRPACCRLITSGNPVTPRFWLEQLNKDGTWSTVAGPQHQKTFSNLAHGTYRVRC